jgi:hypothetical protein
VNRRTAALLVGSTAVLHRSTNTLAVAHAVPDPWARAAAIITAGPALKQEVSRHRDLRPPPRAEPESARAEHRTNSRVPASCVINQAPHLSENTNRRRYGREHEAVRLHGGGRSSR